MTINLTNEEKQDIFLSIMVRIGFIETGTIHRAKDLERTGEKVKTLSSEQMKKVLELEELAYKILNS